MHLGLSKKGHLMKNWKIFKILAIFFHPRIPLIMFKGCMLCLLSMSTQKSKFVQFGKCLSDSKSWVIFILHLLLFESPTFFSVQGTEIPFPGQFYSCTEQKSKPTNSTQNWLIRRRCSLQKMCG